MSTPCFVAIQRDNGEYGSVVIHSDGYGTYMGPMLLKHYIDPDKIERLIELKDVSVFREHIGRKHYFHDIMMQHKIPWDIQPQNIFGWTTFYGRDRGENVSNMNESKWNSYTELMRFAMSWHTWIYVFTLQNEWKFIKIDNNIPIPALSSFKKLNFENILKDEINRVTPEYKNSVIVSLSIELGIDKKSVLKYVNSSDYNKELKKINDGQKRRDKEQKKELKKAKTEVDYDPSNMPFILYETLEQTKVAYAKSGF